MQLKRKNKRNYFGRKLCFSVTFFVLLFFNSCRTHKDVESKVVVKPTASHVQMVAEKLGVSEKEVRTKKLYSFVSDWYGISYKYGGCDRKGIDCSCFTVTLYQKVYGKTVSRNAAAIHKDCGSVRTAHLKEGDFVFFKIGSKQVSHVGVYLRNNKFVHASTSKGVIINDLDEAYYKKYFFEGGRLKN